MNQVDPTQNDRDAVTLRIMGIFFIVLGSLVLVATYWAIGNFRAMIVNLVSGLILSVVGIIMAIFASGLKAENRRP